MTDHAAGHVATPLEQALGRVPSGLFILTAARAGQSTGMLASWVQQAGFEPPMITVAVRRDRYVREWLEETRRFVLNQLPAGHKALIRHFAKGFAPGEPAFEGIATVAASTVGVVLAEALAFLICEVAGQVEGPDHTIFLARVAEGSVLDPAAEPMIHVRRSGHHY